MQWPVFLSGSRRRVLFALVREERLTEGFRDRLMTFRHGGGFSVYGRHLILNEEPSRLAHMARFGARPPLAMDRLSISEDGRCGSSRSSRLRK